MAEELAPWHDYYVSLVTAAAGLLGLLFVALSLHVKVLAQDANAELRAVARTVFIGYVVALAIGFLALVPQTLRAFGIELLALCLFAVVPFALAAGRGFRARGIGYRRSVTVLQFVVGAALQVIALVASMDVASGDASGLVIIGAITVLSLLWGVFNTWELIFRVAPLS
ncbi:MAG TPA: hypothetical protein VM052_05480 [Candidatus Limnocylindrales bacterium]|nr:hypothetical protein [Candidatus Limnocylindrales bacterium]